MNKSKSHIYFFLNCSLLLCTPLVCYYITVSNNHAIKWLPAISSCYAQAPEQWLFAAGVSTFVILHCGIIGTLHSNSDRNKNFNHIKILHYLCPKVLELLTMSLLFILAWLPFYNPAHGIVAIILFMTASIWQVSKSIVDYHANSNRRITHHFRLISSISSIALMIAMAYVFPYQLNFKAFLTDDIEQQLQILNFNPLWTHAAIFEWLFFFNMVLFFISYGEELKNSSKNIITP